MDNGIRWRHNRVADSVFTSYIPCSLKSIEASIEVSPKEQELLDQAAQALARVDEYAKNYHAKTTRGVY